MNTSCPNEGHNRLLCHDPHLVGEITEAVKNEIGDRPLIVKLAYIPNDTDLETMVRETVGHGTVQGFSTINTISARLVARTATRRCRESDVTVPACAATPFVAPVSTWSAGSPPSVKTRLRLRHRGRGRRDPS